MRRTKIICTLGPATDNEEVLRGMMLAGMNVARFNFSHGEHADHLKRLHMLQKLREELGLPVATLLDTKGPEIRLKKFAKGKVLLKTGQLFTLTTHDVEGDENICSITYKNLPGDVGKNTRILLSDGLIAMDVVEVQDDKIICKVQNSGEISNNKSVNVPGVKLSLPYISRQDRNDILFGIEHEFDFIATSFARTAHDIMDVRQILNANGGETVKIIAKIENSDGVNNISEILAVSNGIMIARGDMGVEIDFTEIPIIQKNIIYHCYNSGKPVITATQMLESMMENPRPTRAEITDVANAIYDGTSAIMLSGETAAGKYPVEVVTTMAAIAHRTESDINYDKRLRGRIREGHLSVTDSIAHAACTTAMDVRAEAIITVSTSGETARLVCKYRPRQMIVACVIDEQIGRQLNLSWGITPLVMPVVKTTDELIETSVSTAKAAGYIKDGDLIVLTAGVPLGISGTTNMIKTHLVGDSIVTGVGFSGKAAKGNVCICEDIADLDGKFHPGDILVLKSTNNDMLPHLREAGAIIAEENGNNSHAAIIGLALSKPVIVGATGATQKLRDGMLVMVDTQRGLVTACTN